MQARLSGLGAVPLDCRLEGCGIVSAAAAASTFLWRQNARDLCTL